MRSLEEINQDIENLEETLRILKLEKIRTEVGDVNQYHSLYLEKLQEWKNIPYDEKFKNNSHRTLKAKYQEQYDKLDSMRRKLQKLEIIE